MTWDFTPFLTVFQSYQDNEGLIMKGCVQWNPFTVGKILPQWGLNSGNPRSAGQCITQSATGVSKSAEGEMKVCG